MLPKRAADREWTPSDVPGIDRSLFRSHGRGGRSSVARLAAGARFPRRAQHGQEEVVVPAGEVRIGGATMREDDDLPTEPGEEHDVVAPGDADIVVSSRKATPRVG